MRWLSAFLFVFFLFHLNLISQQYRYLKSAEHLFQQQQIEKGLFDIGQCLRLQTPISPFTSACRLLSHQQLPKFPGMREYIQAADPQLLQTSDMDPKPLWEFVVHGSFIVFFLSIVVLLVKGKDLKYTAGFALLLWFLGG